MGRQREQPEPTITHIHFEPWEGLSYAGLVCRLLVVGDSHYADGPRGRDFTQILTADYAAGRLRHRFWTQISQVVSGEPHSQLDREAVWDRIAFYNYVQEIVVARPGEAPPDAMFRCSEPAFFEVLDRLRPTHVLALGNRLWERMPPLEDESLSAIFGGERRQYGWYRREAGMVFAMGIPHPSWAFSAPRWHSVVRDFLAVTTTAGPAGTPTASA